MNPAFVFDQRIGRRDLPGQHCRSKPNGPRKSRYIGSAKARLQAAWAAAVVNLNPIARHLAADNG